MTGAVKMRSRSRASSRSRLDGPAAPRRNTAAARTAPAGRAAREPPLLERVDRLGDGIEGGGVDLRGARVAVAARKRVGAFAPERDLLVLVLVVGQRDGC